MRRVRDQGIKRTQGPGDQGAGDQGTRGPGDQRTRDQGTTGPGDQRTRGPKDQGNLKSCFSKFIVFFQGLRLFSRKLRFFFQYHPPKYSPSPEPVKEKVFLFVTHAPALRLLCLFGYMRSNDADYASSSLMGCALGCTS